MTETIDVSNLGPNPQSLFQIISEPLPLVPHKCVACNRAGMFNQDNPLKFINFGRDIEFYGTIYLCEDCIREMANQLGFADPEQFLKIVGQINAQATTIETLAKENTELRNALAGLKLVFGDSVSDISTSPASEESNEDDDVKVGDGDDITLKSTGGEEEFAVGEEGLIESTDEQGPSSLSGDDSINDLTEFL